MNRDCEDDYGIGMAIAGFCLAVLIYGSPDANPVSLCSIVGGVGLAMIAKNWLLRRLFPLRCDE